jgi:hypothetical protein
VTRILEWLAAPNRNTLEIAIGEVDAAIALVVSGAARRVRLVGVAAAAEAAPTGAARAQAAGVEFRISRGATGLPTIEVGPRIIEIDRPR